MVSETVNEKLCLYKVVKFSGPQTPASYLKFIYPYWRKSIKNGCAQFKNLSAKQFCESFYDYMKQTVAKKDTDIRLAVLAEDEDTILGFSIANKKTLHYVFVRPEMTKMKIGTSLLPKEFTHVPYLTKVAKIIAGKKYQHLKIRRPKWEGQEK